LLITLAPGRENRSNSAFGVELGWPHQRRLLRDADALRRRGDWPGVLRTLGTYLGLQLRRLPGLRPRV
jgi:hypothetical protein